MENSTGNNKVDEDILQCKADILRVRELIPPYGSKKLKLPDKNVSRSGGKIIAVEVSSTVKSTGNTPPDKILNQISPSAEKTANIDDEKNFAEIPFSESMGEDTIITSDDSRPARIPTFEEIMTRRSPFTEDNSMENDPLITSVISEKTDQQKEHLIIDDDDDENVAENFFEKFVSDTDQPKKTPENPPVAPVEKPAQRPPVVELAKAVAEKPAEILIIKSAPQPPQEPAVEKMKNPPAAPTEKAPEKAAEKTPEKSAVEMVVDSIIDLPEKTDADGEKNENIIPEFNLAEQILSEQRRVSGAKRVSPGKKFEPITPLPDVASLPVAHKMKDLPANAGQIATFTEEYRLPEEILVENIVKRDIENFYSLSRC